MFLSCFLWSEACWLRTGWDFVFTLKTRMSCWTSVLHSDRHLLLRSQQCLAAVHQVQLVCLAWGSSSFPILPLWEHWWPSSKLSPSLFDIFRNHSLCFQCTIFACSDSFKFQIQVWLQLSYHVLQYHFVMMHAATNGVGPDSLHLRQVRRQFERQNSALQ